MQNMIRKEGERDAVFSLRHRDRIAVYRRTVDRNWGSVPDFRGESEDDGEMGYNGHIAGNTDRTMEDL